MKRILVLRGGALGDFIVTLPALQALREQWPDAYIELAGNARAGELGLISGVLDRLHSQQEGRWSQLYSAEPLSSDFAAWLQSFDVILNFWPDPDGDIERHLAPLAAVFIARGAAVKTTPAAAHFCSALEPLGIHTNDYVPRLKLPEPVHAEADRRLEGLSRFLAVHPGSGSPAKNWPIDRWTTLLGRMRRPFLLVSGEAEAHLPLWPAYLEMRRANQWPLPVLAAALARSTLFVGHDSGVSHLAAAAGARCVLLFGPSDPAVWAPPGATVIRRGANPGSISVEDVLAALPAC